jgi:hypothetical protein
MEEHMGKAFLVGLGMLVATTASAAPWERGDQMLWACKGEGPEPENALFGQITCVAYLSGFLDSHSIAVSLGDSREEVNFCLPAAGISNDQAKRIVIKWLESHPSQLHHSSRMLVLSALREALPCNGRSSE